MIKITKKQELAFMKARHPRMRYFKNSDSWNSCNGHGMTSGEAKTEARAEIELAYSGLTKMPVWAQ